MAVARITDLSDELASVKRGNAPAEEPNQPNLSNNKKKAGRPKGSTKEKTITMMFLSKLQQMGLEVSSFDEEVVAMVCDGHAIKGFGDRFDFDAYVLRKLLYMIERGYNDRVRLGAMEMLMKWRGMIQSAGGVQGGGPQAVNPIFGGENGGGTKRPTDGAIEPSFGEGQEMGGGAAAPAP